MKKIYAKANQAQRQKVAEDVWYEVENKKRVKNASSAWVEVLFKMNQ